VRSPPFRGAREPESRLNALTGTLVHPSIARPRPASARAVQRTSGRPRVLVVGGSMNQTTMVHKVGVHLEADCDVYYSACYADGFPDLLTRAGLLDFTVLAGQARRRSEQYIRDLGLRMDYRGARHDYDLIVSTVDLVVPDNHRGRIFVLIQEGMTDPENYRFRLVRTLGLPRYLANTSMNGLSDAYDIFCVSSEGYRDLFARKGIRPEKMVVTGIPNFDHVEAFLDNDFPHKGHVLAATSCLRETIKYEDRRGFIRKCQRVADGRELIFKLHPNENVRRAASEVRRYAPEAIIYEDGDTNHMIANCAALVTKYSSVVYIASALGKEIHCDLDPEVLRRLTPQQNGGTSGRRIARICLSLLGARV